MSEIKVEDVVAKLGSMTVMEMIALTKELEQKWDVKAAPPVVTQVQPLPNKVAEQTEFNVILASVPADKKMSVIKAVRELLTLGLKESKELVEAAPKTLKEAVSKEEAEEIKNKMTTAGAVVEVK
jgi:large subunit ribosomal protein L7/L12